MSSKELEVIETQYKEFILNAKLAQPMVQIGEE